MFYYLKMFNYYFKAQIYKTERFYYFLRILQQVTIILRIYLWGFLKRERIYIYNMNVFLFVALSLFEVQKPRHRMIRFETTCLNF